MSRDKEHKIKAVCVVHNETSTGATSRIGVVRKAIDAAKHPALFLVDTISGLASADYRHDEWGVDVTITGSQKGLMLPPGLGMCAVSEKALAASFESRSQMEYFSWPQRLKTESYSSFCGTAPEHLVFGLIEALKMLDEEGWPQVFARHTRLAGAVRRAADSAAAGAHAASSAAAGRVARGTSPCVLANVRPALAALRLTGGGKKREAPYPKAKAAGAKRVAAGAGPADTEDPAAAEGEEGSLIRSSSSRVQA